MTSNPAPAGRRIRRLREQKGLSRAWLAQLMGVDVTAISAWENDKYRPRVEKRLQLAHVLGVALDELFPESDDIPQGSGAIVHIRDDVEFAKRVLERIAQTKDTMRAVHGSGRVATPPGEFLDLRNLIAKRVLADTMVFEHIEVIHDLSRLKEVVHNILLYDGHPYHLRAYYAAPRDWIPGPTGAVFDDRNLLLGTVLPNGTAEQRVRLAVTGGEIVDYFLHRWSEMWTDATALNPDGARDLSNARTFAIKLGLPPNEWPQFFEEARLLAIPDDAPPLP